MTLLREELKPDEEQDKEVIDKIWTEIKEYEAAERKKIEEK